MNDGHCTLGRIRALALILTLLPRLDELVIVEPPAGDSAAPASAESPRPAPLTWRAGPLDLTAGSIVQLDAARGGERPGFFLRRSRLRFGGRLERLVSLGLRLEVELNPVAEPTGLLDAAIDFRVASRGLADLGRLELGQMKVPLSREVMDAPEDLVFVERPDGARRIAPSRDVGVVYALPLIRARERAAVRFGLFNGEGAGEIGGGGGSMLVVRLEGSVGDPSRARAGGRWGFAVLHNPDAVLDDGRVQATFVDADLALHLRALRLGAELLWRDGADGSKARSAWLWAAHDLVPDVLALRARVETLDDGALTRRLTIGATFEYLSDRFRLLYDATISLPPGDAPIGHVASFLGVL